jgi:hypothetical protein
METTWFITRHDPTADQVALVPGLIKVPDINGFDKGAISALLNEAAAADVYRIVVVNAAMALNIAALALEREQFLCVGIFENAARPAEGGKPTFEAAAIHWWFVECSCAGWTLSY